MTTLTYNYKRVYVWSSVVRFFHWTTAFSTLILIATGFVIANPPALNSNLEASQSFWFGYIRAIHLITAVILVAVVIFRIYWAFVGNRFASWRNFIPFTKKGMHNIWHVIKVDILLMPDKEDKLSNISIGHNYLAAFSYLIMTFLFILQFSTGFALMSATSDWWFTNMFSWILPFFGGDILVRYIHHISTWIFMTFIIVHVYLVLYHDYVDARGEASSMISGYKFVRSERFNKNSDNKEEKTQEEKAEND